MSRRRTLAALALPLVLGTAACTGDDGPDPTEAAESLAAALSAGTPGQVEWDRPRRAAVRWWEDTVDGLGESEPQLEVGEVTESDDGLSAKADLAWTWALRDGPPWQTSGTATLVREQEDDPWVVQADPALLGLRTGERLELQTELPPRAPVLGAGDREIVVDRPVVRFGIDKTRVPPSRQAASARRLAGIVGVTAADLVSRVEAAGPDAFVEAIVLRAAEAGDERRAVGSVEGAIGVSDTMPLAPTREFARPVLGTVGPVTAEIVEESAGAYEAGDEAGLSGLQLRYDAQLRGTPGLTVAAVKGDHERVLLRGEPKPGSPLRTTLDLELQQQADAILAGVGPASALVALRPSDGAVLAVASGPGGEGYSTATLGQYAPGSTFKIVSSLALLRSGLTPGSPVTCEPAVVVDGKRFENYDDYPPGDLGRIDLARAVASSCNTAFISQRSRVEDLAGAAAALGLGVDHDLGYPVFLGSVPKAGAGSETGEAAALIGQGQVLASPVAMAAVMASVVDGSAVLPRLLREDEPARHDVQEPLTATEAGALRTLLQGVVTGGSAAQLADVPGPPVLAKTGTAEFESGGGTGTHAWMVAAQGDLAVAAFVEVGESGSQTAGPLLERLLRAAR